MMPHPLKLCLLILLVACKKTPQASERPLKGLWRATAFYVGDSITNVDVSHVTLELTNNSRFSFVNNIGQAEAGTYIYTDSLLITTDTMVSPPVEKAMHVVKVSKDSLVLRMNFNAKEALMYFRDSLR